jgi:hypothetical protein
MTPWDVAAGIIIGGGVLAILIQSIGFFTYRSGMAAFDQSVKAMGILVALVGLGLAVWIIFFKANL